MELEEATDVTGGGVRGGLGVILGWWGGVGWSLAWWVRRVVLGGVRSWSFYLAVFHARGPRLPLVMGVFYLCFNSLALARLASFFKKKYGMHVRP